MTENDGLKEMFQMHIRECDGRDVRNTKAIDEIKGMFKGIWDSQDKTNDKLAALQNRGALFLGGLIVVGKALDYYFSWMHH